MKASIGLLLFVYFYVNFTESAKDCSKVHCKGRQKCVSWAAKCNVPPCPSNLKCIQSKEFSLSGNACQMNMIDREVEWILGLQRSTGSFLLQTRTNQDPVAISPYSINQALANVLRINTSISVIHSIQKYLTWYIKNLNDDGTIYDFGLERGSEEEVSKGELTAVDSNGASFLSLVRPYLAATGDRQWVISNFNVLRKIIDSVWTVYNSTLKLTYALPPPHQRQYYTMDNVEVWRGCEDYAQILAEIDHPDFEHYRYRAELIGNGIYYNLWNNDRNEFQWYYRSPPEAINWNNHIYAESTANLWPMIYKWPAALGSDKRRAVYSKFKAYKLDIWKNLEDGDKPWIILSEAIKFSEDDQGEKQRILTEYRNNVENKFLPARNNPGWDIGESAAFAVMLSDIVEPY